MVIERETENLMKDGLSCTAAETQVVIAELNLHFSQFAFANAYSLKKGDPKNLNEHAFATVLVETNAEGEVEDKISKIRLALKDGPPCTLPLWGRVVDIFQAARVSRNYLIDLGGSPRLFLDGTSCANPTTSKFCPAWAINILPSEESIRLKKEKQESLKRKQEAARAERAAAAAANPKGKAKKKAKTVEQVVVMHVVNDRYALSSQW